MMDQPSIASKMGLGDSLGKDTAKSVAVLILKAP
jgi:hypothetical protein